jgi:hypothetical protein
MAPSLLLDTHALLWWLVEPEKLSSLALGARHQRSPWKTSLRLQAWPRGRGQKLLTCSE